MKVLSVNKILSVHSHNHSKKNYTTFIEKSAFPFVHTALEKPSILGAGNEIRTRDTKLGKLVLYQLSYARFPEKNI
jgi:hypothetical protein